MAGQPSALMCLTLLLPRILEPRMPANSPAPSQFRAMYVQKCN